MLRAAWHLTLDTSHDNSWVFLHSKALHIFLSDFVVIRTELMFVKLRIKCFARWEFRSKNLSWSRHVFVTITPFEKRGQIQQLCLRGLNLSLPLLIKFCAASQASRSRTCTNPKSEIANRKPNEFLWCLMELLQFRSQRNASENCFKIRWKSYPEPPCRIWG